MRLGLLAGLLSTAPSLAGCNEKAEVRFRVTLAVRDNGKPVVSSSVWAFTLTRGIRGSYEGDLRGEAVVIELPGRPPLYALLTGRTVDGKPTTPSDMAMLPERLFGDSGRARHGRTLHGGDRLADLRDIASRVGETAILDPLRVQPGWNDYPHLVTFENPRDPTSLRSIDPANPGATLGPGVAIEQVSVTVTGDRVTTGRLTGLPSFATATGFAAWYRNLALDDPRRVGPEHFKQGM